MKTYRVYFLEMTANPNAPVARVAFIRATKYAPAWQAARRVLANKPEKGDALYDDAACEKRATIAKNNVIATIVDMTQRNVKLDRDALRAIVNDDATPEAERLAAMRALLG